MDWSSFIDILDVLSPLVTLAFGIYCAVNDTKPKNGKLSAPGRIALWGLIISGAITVLIKIHELQERRANMEAQKKESEKKDSLNSIIFAFQKATTDSLSKSIRELNNIKSASETALVSLDAVAVKQQMSLENTRRGLHPLFPMKIAIEYSIDIKEYYKQNQSDYFRNQMYDYLDTLVYFTSVTEYKRKNRPPRGSKGSIVVPKNIPQVRDIDPFGNLIADSVRHVFKDIKDRFIAQFLTLRFTVHFRKLSEEGGSPKNQIALNFNMSDLYPKILAGSAYENLATTVDMDGEILHVRMLTETPLISASGFAGDFISLYDLQNSIIGFQNDNSETRHRRIFSLNEIVMYTGFEFLRQTSIKFTPNDIKDLVGNETYARKIGSEEIK